MFLIDKYAYQNRWKHISAKYKFGLYLILLAISFSGNPFLQLAMMLVVSSLTCYVVRLRMSRYLKWFLHASVFILISLLTFVVTYSHDSHQFIWSLPIFKGYLGINRETTYQAGFILLRIYSSLVATYFFALTVPFNQMIALFRAMRMPSFLLELIVLMYRFIFLVMSEFLTIRDTLDLKFAFFHKRKTYRAWGMLANTLFIKLIDDNYHLNEVLTLKFDGNHVEK